VAKAGRARKLVDRAVLYATVTAFAAMLAFPFYWMLLATFKTDHDLYDLKNNPLIFNDHPTLANLKLLFDQTLYLTWVWNTVIVGALVVVITLALALPAGYALARLTGKWGERRDIAIFLTYLVPSTLLFIPMSRIVATLGLQDTLWALVVVYPSGHLRLHPDDPGVHVRADLHHLERGRRRSGWGCRRTWYGATSTSGAR
jgi:multiple sugar transport system permease protein